MDRSCLHCMLHCFNDCSVLIKMVKKIANCPPNWVDCCPIAVIGSHNNNLCLEKLFFYIIFLFNSLGIEKDRGGKSKRVRTSTTHDQRLIIFLMNFLSIWVPKYSLLCAISTIKGAFAKKQIKWQHKHWIWIMLRMFWKWIGINYWRGNCNTWEIRNE